MIKKVSIKKIKANPFQMRKKYNRDSIKGLAEEINNFGLWKGSLRGRKAGNHIELCSGHRRLEALKMLGWKNVEIELVDMDDNEMLMQSLVENLQREDLTDIEKANGIQFMIKRFMNQGMNNEEAITKTCKIMGLSRSWIMNLLKLLKMESEVKKAIKQKRIAGRTAMEAYNFGGKKMVKTAIKHKLGVHTISKMSQQIRKVKNDKVQQKLKKEVLEGKKLSPEDVESRAIELLRKEVGKDTDISEIITDWTKTMDKFDEELNNLIQLKELITKHPLQFAHLKISIRKVLQKLNKLL